MGSQIAIPINGAADWSKFVEFSERIGRGYHGVSLTNYDNASEPQVTAGSGLEVGGAFYEFTALESITGWGAIANDTDVWIKVVPASTSITAEFVEDAPTWSTSKQGWYDGVDRYIARLYRDGSGNYTRKRMLVPLGNVRELYQLAETTTTPANTSTGWNTRGLEDEEINEIAGASLAANQITLPAGTYEVEAVQGVGNQSGAQRFFGSRFQNITDASTPIDGINLSLGVDGGFGSQIYLSGRFTIPSAKVFELQIWTNAATNQGYGFGAVAPFKRADLKIWKIA